MKNPSKYRKRSTFHNSTTENIDVLGLDSIDETLLDIFCAYSLSQNAIIHKYGLNNLYKLLTLVSEDYFQNNQVMILKYRFVMEILAHRLKGINNRQLLLSIANKVVDVKPLIQDGMLIRELNNDEVHYVEFTVGEMHNHLYLNSHLGTLKLLWDTYEASDFRAKRSVLQNIRKSAEDLLTQFRKNDVSRDSSDTLFRLSDMENGIFDIHKQVTSPTFKLITGMQGLNAMLGGGFEAGNVYSFFGLPGEGKTVTLENLLAQLWKHNRGYQCRDKTKRPCIVLLTMENFVRQTVCALFHILTKGKNMRDCETAEEAIAEFKKNSFEFRFDDENAIEIVIKFKPINSVTTDYLYQLADNLNDEGYEVIALLQDYVKRILPVMHTGDPYQDLGNVINDFKTFATLRSIPVITASQLNREAAKMIDEGRNANKNDLIKKLGRANIGESARIDENLDGTFIITPEISSEGIKYMGIKLTKHRYEIYTKVCSIYQPFYPDAEIAMVEDLNESQPVYKESLLKDINEIRQSFGEVERVTINKTIKAMGTLNKIEEFFAQDPPFVKPQEKKTLKQVIQFIPLSEIENVRDKLQITKVL